MRNATNPPMDEMDELGAPTPTEDLVPMADREFVPQDFIETQQETIWYNPLDRDYVLDLHVGTKPMGTKLPPRTHEEKHGTRRYTIKSKQRRAIPAEFDIAIQHLQCSEAGCAMRAHHCRNPKHRRAIVGGLGPHLVNVGLQNRPILSASLNEHEAEKKIAIENAMRQMLQTTAAENALVIAQARSKETVAKAEAAQAKLDAENAELRKQLDAEKRKTSPKTPQKDQ